MPQYIVGVLPLRMRVEEIMHGLVSKFDDEMGRTGGPKSPLFVVGKQRILLARDMKQKRAKLW